MPLIRSITFFLSSFNRDKMSDEVSRSLDIIKDSRIKAWTIRYVLPPISPNIKKAKSYKFLERVLTLTSRKKL